MILGKKPDERLKKERIKRIEMAMMRSARLKHLIYNKKSGWADFMIVLEDYMNECKKRKALTRLDQADDAMIYQMKLLDFEIHILNTISRIPKQFIEKLEAGIKEFRKEEESQNEDG